MADVCMKLPELNFFNQGQLELVDKNYIQKAFEYVQRW